MAETMSVNDVKKYSLAADFDKKLSENFRVIEFRCRDGSDPVYVSDELVGVLQKIRDYFGKAVKITSGYRTPAYDRRVGGSGGGYHTKGCAADIIISGVKPIKIAAYADLLLGDRGGIECAAYGECRGYVHIDLRQGRWRALKADAAKKYVSLSNLFPTVRRGGRGQAVKILQRELNEAGFDCGDADGIFGKKTESAVKDYQKSRALAVDGICGKKTWGKILAE